MKVTNTETFIKKAKSIHGDQYDYSETVYTKTRDKVIFKCNHCGEEIEQFAYDHIRVRKSGRFTNVNGGCKNCRIEKLRKDRSHSLESLKSKISECFDTTTYKLDLLTEENMNDELIPFICPLHDKVFYSRKRSTDKSYSVKTPCKFCNNTFKTLCKQLKVEESTHSNIIEMAKETFCIFYIIKISNFYKYGLTSRSIQERYKRLNKPYKVVQEIPCDLYTCVLLEDLLNKYIIDNNLSYYAKELSKVGGCTECYKL